MLKGTDTFYNLFAFSDAIASEFAFSDISFLTYYQIALVDDKSYPIDAISCAFDTSFADGLSATDSLSMGITVSMLDVVGAVDMTAVNATTGLFDSASVLDESTVTIALKPSDLAVAVDVLRASILSGQGDSINTEDFLSSELGTQAVDAVSVGDSTLYSVAVHNGDSLSVSDGFAFSIGSFFEDAATAEDVLVNRLSTYSDDVFSAIDKTTVAVATKSSDFFTAIDTFRPLLLSGLSDGVIVGDSLGCDIGVSVVDSLGVEDRFSAGTPFGDDVSTPDFYSIQFDAKVSDFVSINESIQFGYSGNVAIANIVLTEDHVSRGIEAGLPQDAATVADSTTITLRAIQSSILGVGVLGKLTLGVQTND